MQRLILGCLLALATAVGSAQIAIIDWKDGRSETLRPRGIQTMAATSPIPDGGVVGTRRVLVVNATWPGESPLVTNLGASSLTSTYEGFYTNASYNQLAFLTDVRGVYTLPSKTCDFYAIKDQVIAAADPDVNYANIDHVVAFGPFNGCGWGGISTVGRWVNNTQDGALPFAFSVLPTTSIGVGEHEFGHGLGLTHARSITCSGTLLAAGCKSASCSVSEYGDSYDVMGNSGSQRQPNVRGKETLGWLSGRLVNVNTPSTYMLTPLEDIDGGAKALKIRRAYDDALYVEYRKGVGVLLHVVASTQVTALEDKWWSDSARLSVVLQAGQSFTDPTGTMVSVASLGTTAVLIDVAPVAPDLLPPTVSISPSSLAYEPVSGEVSITATASDNAAIGNVTLYSVSDGNGIQYHDFVSPYEWLWNSASWPNGSLVALTLQACDVAGNYSYSPNHYFVIPQNAIATPTPTPTPSNTPTPTPTKRCKGKSWRCN